MASSPRIVVVGSSNTDMVVRTPSIPGPGETVLGGAFMMAAGGKGANQAVAAARLGAHVTFVARVGRDVFGADAVRGFEAEGIVTDFVSRDADAPSGVALIAVDASGQNSIVVAPGANERLSPADIDVARTSIETADIVVAQLEVPLEAVERAAEVAATAGRPFVLNPAPARPLPPALLALVTVLTPNEVEAAMLLGRDGSVHLDPHEAARALLEVGPRAVIITLGSAGCVVADADGVRSVPAPHVEPVDTTAAGDCFTGALACEIARGARLDDAARTACRAAAISVTRLGAQPSMPTAAEVRASLATG